jgi:hypothetical protein
MTILQGGAGQTNRSRFGGEKADAAPQSNEAMHGNKSASGL